MFFIVIEKFQLSSRVYFLPKSSSVVTSLFLKPKAADQSVLEDTGRESPISVFGNETLGSSEDQTNQTYYIQFS